MALNKLAIRSMRTLFQALFFTLVGVNSFPYIALLNETIAVQQMKTLLVILPVITACGGLAAKGEEKDNAREKQATHHEKNAKSEEALSIKKLNEILASLDKSTPHQNVSFWKYFNDDPIIQAELLTEFKTHYPNLLAAAFKSSGNMHNPKVLPLRAKFSECLLKTPTLTKINETFLAHGHTVKRIDFEKFEIDKEKRETPFHAIIWLVIESKP